MKTSLSLPTLLVVGCLVGSCGDDRATDGTSPTPPALSYQTPDGVYTAGVAIADNVPIVAGEVTSWSVSPPLPAGLALDATTGIISGTPTAEQTAASYVITGTTSLGPTSTAITVAVNLPRPTGLAYAIPNALYVVGAPIAENAPTVTGTVSTWSVSPALPDGLVLSATTGAITGTPTSAQLPTAYSVTAATSGGSVSVELTIETIAPPAGLTLNHTPRHRAFSFSWTAGAAVGQCKLQYLENGASWVDLSATPALFDCDQAAADLQQAFPATDLWTNTFDGEGVSVRLVRASDSFPLGTFAQKATCPSATVASASASPDIDEDCDGRWDNQVPKGWVFTNTYQNCFPEYPGSNVCGNWDPTQNPDPANYKYAHVEPGAVDGGCWQYHPPTGLYGCREDWYEWWEWQIEYW